MSAFAKTLARTSLNLLALGLTTWFATAPLSAAARVPAGTVPLTPGDTWRGPGGEPGESALFSIRVDAPGLLLVDVDAPVAAPAVRLALLRPADGAAPRLLGRSATSLVLAAAPGDYRLRVVAEDPQRPLAALRLRTRFAAARLEPAILGKSQTSTEIEIDPDPLRIQPSTEIEIDPDPLRIQTSTEIEIDPDPLRIQTSTEIEIDPDPLRIQPSTEIEIDPDPLRTQTSTEIEIDPDPLRLIGPAGGSPGSVTAGLLRQLCRQGESDDHGDSFACATPLAPGTAAQGALGNDHGDDSDVFRFEVSAFAPVEIRARSPFPLAGELYDRHGQRLDTAVAEGSGGLRLVRTLVPGTYFLRLEGGNGAEGAYTLTWGRPHRNP